LATAYEFSVTRYTPARVVFKCYRRTALHAPSAG
jgi:hypothetical protein